MPSEKNNTKFCIFCGREPEKKSREHVLPQWLIKMTGDPGRTVNFGMDPISGKVPRFDWSSFTFPACTSCNEKYSALENDVKPLVQKILDRQAIRARDYILVLDWLDKVRIGLWLGYFLLHKNPLQIAPSFHIDSRLGKKDRMLAVYTIDSDRPGLNAWGAETLCFQFKPSCFSLRINSVVLTNISSDFLCAARCGFPFPYSVLVDLDLGTLEASEYVLNRKVKHPLMRRKIIKPSIHIFEPILQCPEEIRAEHHAWLEPMLLDGGKGVVFRQWDDRVEVLMDSDSIVENDQVKGWHSRPLKEIIAQTYSLQFEMALNDSYKSSDKEKLQHIKGWLHTLRKDNARYVSAFLAA
jgi:hypothetical protein